MNHKTNNEATVESTKNINAIRDIFLGLKKTRVFWKLNRIVDLDESHSSIEKRLQVFRDQLFAIVRRTPQWRTHHFSHSHFQEVRSALSDALATYGITNTCQDIQLNDNFLDGLLQVTGSALQKKHLRTELEYQIIKLCRPYGLFVIAPLKKYSTESHTIEHFLLYKRLGTLQRVGNVCGVTRERVRQILARGERQGLFAIRREYPIDMREMFLSDLYEYGSYSYMAKATGYTPSAIERARERFAIADSNLNVAHQNRKMRNREKRKANYYREYYKIVEELGQHPTTTQLTHLGEKRGKWRATYIGMLRFWGTIEKFRAENHIDISLSVKSEAPIFKVGGISDLLNKEMRAIGKVTISTHDVEFFREFIATSKKYGFDWKDALPSTIRTMIINAIGQRNRLFRRVKDPMITVRTYQVILDLKTRRSPPNSGLSIALFMKERHLPRVSSKDVAFLEECVTLLDEHGAIWRDCKAGARRNAVLGIIASTKSIFTRVESERPTRCFQIIAELST